MSAAKRASLKDKNPLDDLFQRTDSAEEQVPEPAEVETEEASAADEPTQDLGELRQTTLMAYEKELNWLALKVIEARTNGGKAISKSDIIRTLIDIAMTAPVDLSGLSSEEELEERLEIAIKNKNK